MADRYFSFFLDPGYSPGLLVSPWRTKYSALLRIKAAKILSSTWFRGIRDYNEWNVRLLLHFHDIGKLIPQDDITERLKFTIRLLVILLLSSHYQLNRCFQPLGWRENRQLEILFKNICETRRWILKIINIDVNDESWIKRWNIELALIFPKEIFVLL